MLSVVRNIFIAAILMLTATTALADVELYAGAWSDHLFSTYDYNETHNLAAIEVDDWFVGYFRNSYDEDAFTAAYHWKINPIEDVEIGVLGGGVYGYRDCFEGWAYNGRKLCPMLAPTMTWVEYNLQPVLYILGQAVAVGLRYQF